MLTNKPLFKSYTKNSFNLSYIKTFLNKNKIKLYNISNLYYKKFYRTLKPFGGVIYKYIKIKFNIMNITIVLFHKKNKEYVVIREYININNLGYCFYK
nr:hypothetical protein BXAP_25 [Babesia sp. Xinjiang]QAX26988.1 hypothetical protein [Babesia sp. Xinjiang]